MSVSEDYLRLKLQGVKFDKIQRALDLTVRQIARKDVTDGEDPDEATTLYDLELEEFSPIQELLLQARNNSTTWTSWQAQTSSPDCLWRTMVADQSHTGAIPAPFSFDRMYRLWAGEAHPDFDPKSGLPRRLHEARSVLASIQPLVERMNLALKGRAFFITTNGFIGIGPRGMLYGDVVAILRGGRVPMVLRAIPLKYGAYMPPRHSLVGECYVHGIMQGELIQDDGSAVLKKPSFWADTPEHVVGHKGKNRVPNEYRLGMQDFILE
ncbi:hypothetical protein LTR28_007123 [Elasticomyces elasticus]|nr:hypothetical protein LTR28_007123 [Elasticomyces elasticus]